MAIVSKLLAITIIILSSWSFVPQVRLLWTNRTTAGLSASYILFNLVSAMQQLTLGLHGILIEPKSFLHSHPKASFDDWLNVVQFTVVWLGHLAIFVSLLSLSPVRTAQKTALVIAYCVHLSFTLCIVAYEAMLEESSGAGWVRGMFVTMHLMIVNPIVNLLSIAAYLLQVRVMRASSSNKSLSVSGLAIQAVVFLLAGISWLFRLRIPRGSFRTEPGQPRYSTCLKVTIWYQTVGWATVANVIFAGVQAGLFITAGYGGEIGGVGGVTPLIGES